jgi:hypothetical protein
MESKEKPPRKEYKPGDHYRGIRPPHKVPGCRWQLFKRHPEKSYPEEWILTSKEPYEPSSIDELPPVGVEGKLYKTKEEALKENPPLQPGLPNVDLSDYTNDQEF